MNFTNAFANPNGKPPGGIEGFDAAERAPEYTPLPPGIYNARILQGETTSTKAGDDAYRIRFEITEGDHVGKTVQRLWTFGPKAIGHTKRELEKFGLTAMAHLLAPFPPADKDFFVKLMVAIKRGDDGTEFNDIKRIEILRIEDSPAAKFMLKDKPEGGKPL